VLSEGALGAARTTRGGESLAHPVYSQGVLVFARGLGTFGTTSVQLDRRNWRLGLELSNATSSIYWIFALLFDEAHNPKVVSSNLTPATISKTCLMTGLRDE
jgi:hypothetical protein